MFICKNLKILKYIAVSLAITTSASGSNAENSNIELYGDIKLGDAERLEQQLKASNKQPVIYFNSIGGHIAEAIRIGQIIRKHNAATYIPPNAQCTSACILAFIGGVTRITAPTAEIGSHQSFWKEGSMPEPRIAVSVTQNIASKSLQHFIEMGVAPEAYSIILATPPEKMYLFTQEEQARYMITSSSSEPMAVGSATKKAL